MSSQLAFVFYRFLLTAGSSYIVLVGQYNNIKHCTVTLCTMSGNDNISSHSQQGVHTLHCGSCVVQCYKQKKELNLP